MDDLHTVCEHGSLKRQCAVCELHQELAMMGDERRQLIHCIQEIVSLLEILTRDAGINPEGFLAYRRAVHFLEHCDAKRVD